MGAVAVVAAIGATALSGVGGAINIVCGGIAARVAVADVGLVDGAVSPGSTTTVGAATAMPAVREPTFAEACAKACVAANEMQSDAVKNTPRVTRDAVGAASF